MFKRFFFIFCILINSFCNAKGNLAEQIKNFVSAEARMIWVDCKGGNQKDFQLEKSQNILFGIDTQFGKIGARPLLQKKMFIRKPLLSPDGKFVFFTDTKNFDTFFLKWSQVGKQYQAKKLTHGICMTVWQDPKSKKTWVYIGEPSNLRATFGQLNPHKIFRINLHNPAEREEVWEHQALTLDNFSITRDGSQFISMFPWPRIGIGHFSKRDWYLIERGCWPNYTPGKEIILSIFDGSHHNLRFYSIDPPKKWKVLVDQLPGSLGHEVYHPLWSNHPRFLAMTGPFSNKNERGPNVFAGSQTADVWIAKFSSDLSKVEKFLRITKNNYADLQPCLWIQGGEKINLDYQKVIEKKRDFRSLKDALDTSWPGDAEKTNLTYVWQNFKNQNRIKRKGKNTVYCSIEPRAKAVPGRFGDLKLAEGYAQMPQADFNRIIKEALKNKQMSFEFAISTWNLNQGKNANKTIMQMGSRQKTLIKILQKGIQLEFQLLLKNKIITKFGFLQPKSPNHLLISFDKDKLKIYMNGARKKHKIEKIDYFWHNLKNNMPGKIIFGNSFDLKEDWHGRLEYVAFFSHFFKKTDASLAKSMQLTAVFNSRKEQPSLILKAEVLKNSPIRSIKTLKQYRRSMCIYTYRFKELVQGKLPNWFDKNKPFTVAHWSILDKKYLTSLPRKVGSIHTWLELRPWEIHPMLESERKDNNIDSIDFYDCGIPSGKLVDKIEIIK